MPFETKYICPSLNSITNSSLFRTLNDSNIISALSLDENDEIAETLLLSSLLNSSTADDTDGYHFHYNDEDHVDDGTIPICVIKRKFSENKDEDGNPIDDIPDDVEIEEVVEEVEDEPVEEVIEEEPDYFEEEIEEVLAALRELVPMLRKFTRR